MKIKLVNGEKFSRKKQKMVERRIKEHYTEMLKITKEDKPLFGEDISVYDGIICGEIMCFGLYYKKFHLFHRLTVTYYNNIKQEYLVR